MSSILNKIYPLDFFNKVSVDVRKKADKVLAAVRGHFAGLDSSGNLTDSGVSPDDFYVKDEADAMVAHAIAEAEDTIDAAIQGVQDSVDAVSNDLSEFEENVGTQIQNDITYALNHRDPNKTVWSDIETLDNRITSTVTRIDESLDENGEIKDTEVLQTIIDQRVDENEALARISSRWAVLDENQRAIEWVVSGFESQAAPGTSFATVYAADKTTTSESIAALQTSVEGCVAEATLATKVEEIIEEGAGCSSIADLALHSDIEESSAVLATRIETVEEEAGAATRSIAALQESVTEDEANLNAIASFEGGQASLRAGLVTSADVDSAVASLIASSTSNETKTALIEATVDTVNNSSSITLAADQIRLAGSTLADTIHADQGYIGGANGFTIASQKLYSGMPSFDSIDNGVYVGTNGIALGGGKFKVDDRGSLIATSASITGNIVANSLTLNSGATIPAGSVTGLQPVATSGNYDDLTGKPEPVDLQGYIQENGVIGSTPAPGATGFVVSDAGLLQASNAVIYGSLYSSVGTIGGLTLANNALYHGMTSLDDITHNGVWLGTGGIALGQGKFKVTDEGAITAERGTIGGMYINSEEIYSDPLASLQQGRKYLSIKRHGQILGGAADFPTITTEYMSRQDPVTHYNFIDYAQISPVCIQTATASVSGGVIGSPTITNCINSDGSGSLGKGGISWDTEGNFEVGNSMFEAMFQVMGSETCAQITSESITISNPDYSDVNSLYLSPNIIRVEDEEDGLIGTFSPSRFEIGYSTGTPHQVVTSLPRITIDGGSAGPKIYLSRPDEYDPADDEYTTIIPGKIAVTMGRSSNFKAEIRPDSITVTGPVTATQFITSSDENLKDKVNDIEISAEQIAEAPAITYTWKNDTNEDKDVMAGTIAQYWKEILPEVVIKSKDGTLCLNYQALATVNTIMLAKEIVALKQEIAELKKRQ